MRVVPVVGELGAQLLRCGQCARRGGEREGKYELDLANMVMSPLRVCRSHHLGVRSHHPGVKEMGKSAPGIAHEIAESLPPSAKVPISQSVLAFGAAASRRCFRLGNEVLRCNALMENFAAGGFATDPCSFFLC